MDNIYVGNFTEDEKMILGRFQDFKFWKTEDGIYAKYSLWNESDRIRRNTIYDIAMSLTIYKNSGGFRCPS